MRSRNRTSTCPRLAKGKRLPLIRDGHTFSASALNTYADCPLRYKFQYVLLVPSSPRTYFSFGQAVHSVIEQLSRDNINGIPFSKERALALLDADWDASAYPSTDAGGRRPDRRPKLLLDTFLDWQAKNRNTILAAEQRFRFRLGERTVTGYIDRIEQQPDGGLVVIDFKTGSKPSNITKAGIREDIQMNIYCMAVQAMLREAAGPGLALLPQGRQDDRLHPGRREHRGVQGAGFRV